MMRILFTSDLHGRPAYYEQLWQIAPEYDAVILGGDLLPSADVQQQRQFLEQILEQIAGVRERFPNVAFYAILGNDDWGCHQDLLEQSEQVQAVAGRCVSLGAGWYLLGYGYVSPTPFRMKDWERWDLKPRRLGRFVAKGYRSTNGRIESFDLRDDRRTIAEDLKELATLVPDFSRTVCVMHDPPNGTPLDRIFSGHHVGSRAIRAFIETHQPLLTLHGHIHESPQRTGRWFTRLGRSVCVNPGQGTPWHYVRITLQPLTLTHAIYGPAELEPG